MEFSKKITGLFSSLFGKPEFSDIEILLQDGNKIPAHKLILYVRNNSWGLDDFINADYLDLSMFQVSIIMIMLKWVYTDHVDINGVSIQSLTQLISVAKFYNLRSFYTRCETALHRTQIVEQYKIVTVQQSRDDLRDIGLKISDRNPLKSDSKSLVSEVSGTNSKVTTETAITMDTTVKTQPESQNAEIRIQPVTKDAEVGTSHVIKDTIVVSDEEEETNSDSEEMGFENNDCDEDFEVDNISQKSSGFPRHSASKMFTCSICGKTFQSKSHLANHVIIHTGVKEFICDECGKSFNRRSSLVRHQNIHTNEILYFCEICEKSFADGSYLKKHRMIHFNIQNYVCKICSRKFTDSSNYKRHVRGQHGLKKYPCLECKKRFRDASTLHRHSRYHK